MKLIIDADKAKIENGHLIIECNSGQDFTFRITSNDTKRIVDYGWIRVTRNNTLSVVRVK